MLIGRILGSQSKSIVSAAAILGAASLISRVLGAVRDIVLIRQIGVGDVLDAYYGAFRIPDLVFSLIVLGAVSSGFIPVFVDYWRKDEKKAWYLVSSVFNIVSLLLIVICLMAIMLMPWFIRLVVPGFEAEKLALTVKMSRIMFLSPVILGASSILGGAMQGLNCFIGYSLGAIFYNVGIIFGALFFVKYFGPLGLAYGVILGAFLHFIIRVPILRSLGYGWRPVFDWKFEGVRRIFRLMPPRILSLALSQVDLWALTFFASFLERGSIARSNIAYNIWSLPLGIFGISLTSAAFPRLSAEAQARNIGGFVRTFVAVAKQIIFLTLPSMFLIFALRQEVSNFIFILARGNGFDWRDVFFTSQILVCFSVSLISESVNLLFLKSFFAWEDTKTPFLVGAFETVLRFMLMWVLSGRYGAFGLVIGFSIGSFVQTVLLSLAFRLKMKRCGFGSDWIKGEAKVGPLGLKVIVSACVSYVFAYLALHFVAHLVNVFDVWGILGAICLSGATGLAAFLLATRLFRVEESAIICKDILRKIRFRKNGSASD